MNPDCPQHFRAPRGLLLALALCLAGLSAPASALPDDRLQDLKVEFSRSETYLDQGRTVFFGRPQQPAVISQGSLRITGLEITLERSGNGDLLRITATGTPTTPASFQQQPEIDQDLIHASGRIIVYDNVESMLTIDVDAQLRQAGSTVQGHHIDYDLQSRMFGARSSEDGEQVEMIIPASSLDRESTDLGNGGASAERAGESSVEDTAESDEDSESPTEAPAA